MHKLLNSIYKGDHEPERTFRLLRIFQATRPFIGSPPCFLVLDIEEGPTQEDVVIADNGIMIEQEMLEIMKSLILIP